MWLELTVRKRDVSAVELVFGRCELEIPKVVPSKALDLRYESNANGSPKLVAALASQGLSFMGSHGSSGTCPAEEFAVHDSIVVYRSFDEFSGDPIVALNTDPLTGIPVLDPADVKHQIRYWETERKALEALKG